MECRSGRSRKGNIIGVEDTGVDLGGVLGGGHPPPPEIICGFLHSYTKSAESFEMYCQQFTLCYCLAKGVLLRQFDFKIGSRH